MDLLRAESLSTAEAQRACDATFRDVAPAEARLARLLDAERRDDLAVLVAWFTIASHYAPRKDAPFEERRQWDELKRELEAAFDGEARTPLGRALAGVVSRRPLDSAPFRDFLTLAAAEGDVAIHQTRGEVEARARATVRPWTTTLLPILAADSERRRILAEALAVGCLLAHWWSRIGRDWRLDGRLRVPMEDLGQAGVDLASIDRRTVGSAFRTLLAVEGTWALQWIGRGWDLTRELGPWRGRLLAAAVRRRLAALDAVVRRGADLDNDPARTPRLLAASSLVTGLVARRRPRLVPPPQVVSSR